HCCARFRYCPCSGLVGRRCSRPTWKTSGRRLRACSAPLQWKQSMSSVAPTFTPTKSCCGQLAIILVRGACSFPCHSPLGRRSLLLRRVGLDRPSLEIRSSSCRSTMLLRLVVRDFGRWVSSRAESKQCSDQANNKQANSLCSSQTSGDFDRVASRASEANCVRLLPLKSDPQFPGT